MSVLQAAGQAVSSVASDVVDTAKTAVGDSAKQIAKTPLDILEELLGSSGDGADAPQKESTEEQGQGGGALQQAAIQQKLQQDDQYKEQQHQQLHTQIQQQSQAYYEQKKQIEEQQKQVEAQQKDQEKFQIKQLEKQKSSDYALKAAQDASSAEKRVGAG